MYGTGNSSKFRFLRVIIQHNVFGIVNVFHLRIEISSDICALQVRKVCQAMTKHSRLFALLTISSRATDPVRRNLISTFPRILVDSPHKHTYPTSSLSLSAAICHRRRQKSPHASFMSSGWLVLTSHRTKFVSHKALIRHKRRHVLLSIEFSVS